MSRAWRASAEPHPEGGDTGGPPPAVPRSWFPSQVVVRVLGACLALLSGSGAADNAQTILENDRFLVRFAVGSPRFTITDKATQQCFVREGSFGSVGQETRLVGVRDSTFGHGRALEVRLADGNEASLMLFAKLPFVLVRSRLHNRGTAPLLISRCPTLTALVDLGKPAQELRTLGTGGLLAVDKNPGSYAWLTVADPPTRHGVVAGWLTFNRGSGVLFSRIVEGRARMEARLDYGRLRLAPGKTENLETLAIGYFDDARLGLEAWADTIAQLNAIRLPPQPAGYCTWYSRPYGGASDEAHLAEEAAFAARNLAPYGFSVVQIDDGWQAGISTNGPKRNFTTNAPRGPYPSGMKAIAERLKRLGLTPGLWFMPFAGTYYDPLFAGHQDWFVQREDGRPFETDWGGTCLDLTQPPVREYLRANIRRIGRDWGFGYFKMDGLWTGTATRQIYVNSGYREDGLGEAVLHDPDKTNLEAYRDGLKLVRRAAGRRVFILGCCTPQNMRSYGGAFGLVDAMRIGPDNGTRWASLLNGPRFGSRQYFLHGRVWYNDPDPIYVRASLPLNEARLICSWVTLSGQMCLSSEWLPDLPAARLDLLKRTLPSHGLLPRPVDLFESPLPRVWLLTDTRHTPRRDVIGLFNWADEECAFDSDWKRIGLAEGTQYSAFDYWEDGLAMTNQERLSVRVPPHACRVLALRPRAAQPQLISTSRHITQGIVDVVNEAWDPRSRTLRGRSKVVGHDPYELRVLLPSSADGAGRWRASSIAVAGPDAATGFTARLAQAGVLVRATLESAASREVAWAIRFDESGGGAAR